ncbi:hypothetical protein [Anaeromyxobacter oryzae]|nr:hypothetical protein [Anaeromyxobacter oryzae]
MSVPGYREREWAERAGAGERNPPAWRLATSREPCPVERCGHAPPWRTR